MERASTMEPAVERRAQRSQPGDPQLIFLGQNDVQRVLEVYVKRTLSLNDGQMDSRQAERRSRRWGTMVESHSKLAVRRASSDSSVHLEPEKNWEVVSEQDLFASPAVAQDGSMERGKKDTKTSKKMKKASFFKSFMNLFTKKEGEDKEDAELHLEETRCSEPPPTPESPPAAVTCLPIPRQGPAHPPALRAAKSLKKKNSFKRFSFKREDEGKARVLKKPSSLALNVTVHKPEVIPPVAPNNEPRVQQYYEKLSEEMQRIVKEVKDSPDEVMESVTSSIEADCTTKEEEIIQQIVSCLQKSGDDINGKLKESASLRSFFQSLTYSSFRELADRYVETELHVEKTPQAPPLELVKFAVTLDFTAKVAGICNHTVGRIMGFGNQYLQDRFTQYKNGRALDSNFNTTDTMQSPD
ncbi:uncharacterized protein LOC136749415 isoform X2 [Amia ocellicauda]|uniref:uncharacterized protein LOC136749415 isoform X2 n=1 Tax=Amia ocellicauda TaxID=2972642 RepID=UPI003463971D